jgi:hypothetical protein
MFLRPRINLSRLFRICGKQNNLERNKVNQTNKYIELKMKRLQIILITLAISSMAMANEYHVAKTGSDNNKGTVESPFPRPPVRPPASSTSFTGKAIS